MAEVSNITVRKRSNTTRSRSLEYHNTSGSMSSVLSDDVLGNSLDLPTDQCSTYITEMKDEIKLLKTNLESTQIEMENIILENIELKKQITNMNQELEVLKQICRSPITSLRQNMSSSNKKSARRRLTDILQETPLKLLQHEPENTVQTHVELQVEVESKENSINIPTTDPLVPDNIPTGNIKLITDYKGQVKETNIMEDNITIEEKELTEQVKIKEQIKVKDKKKILILADEAGRDLGRRLQKLVGDDYRVMSVIKPYAVVEHVVDSGTSCKDFTKSDFVILLAGSNDKNPMTVQSYLYYTLDQLKHTNVLVCRVYRNRHLNENNLNSLIRHVCSYCTNSEFVSLDHNAEERYPGFDKLEASRLLYREIIRAEQRYKYVHYINNMLSIRLQRKTRSSLETNLGRSSLSVNVATQTAQTSPPQEFFRE